MDSLRWKNIEEIIVSALDLPDSERRDFVAANCGDDEDLRFEIESLLAQETTDFLEKNDLRQLVETVFENEDEAASVGKKIGHYQIIREIGQGGMGTVFLAGRSDGEFEQQVAIKIIRQAIVGSEIINHFKRERQILATLNHPHIAKLLDGGVSADGLPFLAMEFIEGERITKFVAQEDLSIEDRLKLFLKVCSAVAYAHQSLVVHRDLKPSNIMVTAQGEPKLLDFGLAKMLDENLLTDSNQTQTVFRALTPTYASPEQLRGEQLNTTSDIYSLGIILYELLTGERPFNFEGKSLEQIIKTATDYAPPLPSATSNAESQNSKLRGDLDNIVLTALQKEPERRYQSVEKFSDDIERYLDGLPVSARPNTFKYRAGKFIKRHRYGVATATLIVFLLAIGIVAVLAEARRAEVQRAQADLQRERAEKRFGEVRKLSNSLLFEIHDSVQNLEGSTPTRQLIVSRALEYLDSLAQESGDDPGLQIELATAYQKVGDIQGNPYSANLGDTDGALASYQKSVSILENLNNSPTIESQMALGKAYRAVGDILEVQGNVAECVNNYRLSLAIFEKLDSQNPDKTEIRDELARAYATLGDGLSRTEDGAAAGLQNYRKDLAILQNLVLQNPQDRKFLRSLAIAYQKVGGASDAKQPESAENIEKSIAILEDLSNTEPTNARARREIGIAYTKLGEVLNNAEKYVEALKARRKAFDIKQLIADQDPQNKQAEFDVGIAYISLSEAATNTGDTAQALTDAGKAQEILEKLSKEDADNAIYRRNIGVSYKESAEAYEQAAKNSQSNAAERLKNWRTARDWYQKTKQIFVELKNRNELQPRDETRISKSDEKISSCEKSITELTSKTK